MIDLQTVKIIEAYLIHGKSHRDIQREILGFDAPANGGGFMAMEVLHKLGITGEKKGMLKNKEIDDEIKHASGVYLNTLIEYKEYKRLAKIGPSKKVKLIKKSTQTEPSTY